MVPLCPRLHTGVVFHMCRFLHLYVSRLVCMAEAAYDEIDILGSVHRAALKARELGRTEHSHVVQLLDSFEHDGPHGKRASDIGPKA